MESSEIDRRFARKSRQEVKSAATQSSGGKKIMQTPSGGSSIRGSPGRKPRTRPPRTSSIGYGTSILEASVASTVTATRSPRTTPISGRAYTSSLLDNPVALP